MNINEWIKEYAEDNDIEIPDGIGETNTVLNFLQLNASGGSSLPSVTSADEGKVLAVATTYTKGVAIVPQQTVTLADEKNGVCANANIELFTDDTKAIAVVNGEEYQGVIREGGVYISESEGFYLDDSIFYYNDEGEIGSQFNVALYVAVPQYGWAAENRVLIVNLVDDVADKTWNEIKSALDNFMPVYVYYSDNGYSTFAPITACNINGGRYTVFSFSNSGNIMSGNANDPDGYADFS